MLHPAELPALFDGVETIGIGRALAIGGGGKSAVNNVSIRPVARSDAAALIAANRASTDLHFPWVFPFTDDASFASYFAQLDGERNIGLVAHEGGTERIVGVFNFTQIVRGAFQNAYLGFYGMAGTAGRGLMSAAMRLALSHAFGEIGLHRVEANVQPDNARSLALIERAGFRREGFSPRYLQIGGIWRDHERWAILAEEFEAAG